MSSLCLKLSYHKDLYSFCRNWTVFIKIKGSTNTEPMSYITQEQVKYIIKKEHRKLNEVCKR